MKTQTGQRLSKKKGSKQAEIRAAICAVHKLAKKIHKIKNSIHKVSTNSFINQFANLAGSTNG